MTYIKNDMLPVLENFPEQCKEAINIAKKIKIKAINNVIICGMGGSGISGLLAEKFQDKIPIKTHNDYNLPYKINNKTLVICISYSGNTEETLSAYKEAKKRKAKLIAITTNGLLAKKEKNTVIIPKGLQPRNAVGYLFLITLTILSNSKIIKRQDNQIKEAIRLIKKKKLLRKQAYLLAKKIYGNIPIFYSSSLFNPVAYRLKSSVNETAKQPAFHNSLPESNHNELVGFKNMAKKFEIIFIKDRADNKRVKKRMEITAKLIKHSCNGASEIETKGKSLLARFLTTIYIGDFIAYYLALMNKEDPIPIKIVDELKRKLK